ncbi:MAG: preprotein translocase subunit SecY [Alphaproteobacteria bacterium]|nr:preprotein translocase subunit SecY [Alphaproteobacteria bacterium]MDD9919526.1 preprotein translocase subunit SecY [Alphaproteobacteria bacterium]
MTNAVFGNQSEVADLLSRAKDLQKRILFVLGAFIIYRLGTHIPLPGIDAGALSAYQTQLQQGVFGLFNMFSGGAFSRMAIFALNIMPYITASIIIQLMSATSPTLSELKKEGEVGRRKITQYTRYLTVVLAFAQGVGLASGIETQTVSVGNEVVNLVINPGLAFRLQTALTIMTGTMFLMWLGEQINVKGIGNGISLLIFAGIVAEMPSMVAQIVELARTGALSGFVVIAILVGMLAAIFFITFMETAQRRIAVQYPKRQTAAGNVMSEANHLPLKVNMAGVIPPIFASALLMAPITAASFAPNSAWAQFIGAWISPGKPVYIALFVAMIFFFCFFYTATVAFNAEETADNLKKNGGFLPGIRPGQATAKYLDSVVTRLTVLGATYIAFVCAVPDLLHANQTIPMYIGGTSLLIMVSVTIDTVSRIQSAIIAQKYESLLKKSALRGRRQKKS